MTAGEQVPGMVPSEGRTAAVPPGRRGWLIGTAVALVAAIALIAFMATRGGSGSDHGNMPGMDMQSRGPDPQGSLVL